MPYKFRIQQKYLRYFSSFSEDTEGSEEILRVKNHDLLSIKDARSLKNKRRIRDKKIHKTASAINIDCKASGITYSLTIQDIKSISDIIKISNKIQSLANLAFCLQSIEVHRGFKMFDEEHFKDESTKVLNEPISSYEDKVNKGNATEETELVNSSSLKGQLHIHMCLHFINAGEYHNDILEKDIHDSFNEEYDYLLKPIRITKSSSYGIKKHILYVLKEMPFASDVQKILTENNAERLQYSFAYNANAFSIESLSRIFNLLEKFEAKNNLGIKINLIKINSTLYQVEEIKETHIISQGRKVTLDSYMNFLLRIIETLNLKLHRDSLFCLQKGTQFTYRVEQEDLEDVIWDKAGSHLLDTKALEPTAEYLKKTIKILKKLHKNKSTQSLRYVEFEDAVFDLIECQFLTKPSFLNLVLVNKDIDCFFYADTNVSHIPELYASFIKILKEAVGKKALDQIIEQWSFFISGWDRGKRSALYVYGPSSTGKSLFFFTLLLRIYGDFRVGVVEQSKSLFKFENLIDKPFIVWNEFASKEEDYRILLQLIDNSKIVINRKHKTHKSVKIDVNIPKIFLSNDRRQENNALETRFSDISLQRVLDSGLFDYLVEPKTSAMLLLAASLKASCKSYNGDKLRNKLDIFEKKMSSL